MVGWHSLKKKINDTFFFRSLGCIFYEMLVGAPPFTTTSILHLVQLLRYEPVKWPDFVSPSCLSLLQGLLEKDPVKRFTWPQLLDHNFIKECVLITNSAGMVV